MTPEAPAGPTSPAQAIVTGPCNSRVEDPAEASTLYNKGFYGVPQTHGTLLLDPLETVYLTEVGRLRPLASREEEEGMALEALIQLATEGEPTFDVRYLVYRDLRQRGYVVKRGTGNIDFAVLPRGGSYPKTPSQYWVRALSERTPFSLPELIELLDRAHRAKKKLLLGVVDEESDLTYYLPRPVQPRGYRPGLEEGKDPPFRGALLEDRVSVFDPKAIEVLGGAQLYGSPVGGRLELSLLEALFLLGEGRLALTDGVGGRALPAKTFLTRAEGIEPDLARRLPIYTDLRRSGLIPKTGFKYGTHFRAYESDPATSHAKYLVHAVDPTFSTSWPELSRAIRVAQGVRKSFLLSYAPETGVRHIHLQRVRP